MAGGRRGEQQRPSAVTRLWQHRGRMRSAVEAHRLATAAEAFLIGALLCLPLALGGAPIWALWPLALLSGLAIALTAAAAIRTRRRLRIPMLAMVPFAGAVLCALQLVPLPAPLLDFMSPAGAELRDFALLPLGLDGTRPISLDPPSTWRELTKHLAYAGAIVAATYLAHSRTRRLRLLAAVALAGMLVAVIGFAHEVLQQESLFGIWRYRQAEPPLLTTFGNPNHLAGFLGVSSTIALGLFTSEQNGSKRVLWGLAALMSAAGAIWSLSRAGIICFVGAQLVFVTVTLWRKRERQNRPGLTPAAPGAPVLVALGGVLAGLYLAWEQLRPEVASVDSVDSLLRAKIRLWPEFGRGAWEFARGGMGRGAFELGFARFQEEGGPLVTYTHPENVILQLGAEFGVPGALLVIGLGAFVFVQLCRRVESALDVAAVCAVGGLVVHNLFDFSLELPASAFASSVVLACLCRRDLHRGSSGRSEEGDTGSTKRWAIASLVVAALIPVTLIFGRDSVAAAEDALRSRYYRGDKGALIRDAGLPLIDRHPAGAGLYRTIAAGYAVGATPDPKQALAFINRALILRPVDPDAHAIAARALVRMGKTDQALSHFRRAYALGRREDFLLEGLNATRPGERLDSLVPPEPGGRVVLAEALWARGRKAEARQLLEAARLELVGPSAAPVSLTAAKYRHAEGDSTGALAVIDEVLKVDPEVPGAWILRGDILAHVGRRKEAIEELGAAVVAQPEASELSFALAAHLLSSTEPRKAEQVLERAAPFITAATERSQYFLLRGRALSAQGRIEDALAAFRMAMALEPSSAWIRYAIARELEARAQYGVALEIGREAISLDKSAGADAQQWIESLSERAQRTSAPSRRLRSSE